MDNGLNIKVNMNKKRVLFLIFLVLLLIPGLVSIAFSGEKILHSKIKSISPEKTDGQYCFIKVIIKQNDDEIITEEILECADGKKQYDGPSYCEMFAQFYYAGVNTSEYCRYYSRPEHALKSFGEVCLSENGKWEVK